MTHEAPLTPPRRPGAAPAAPRVTTLLALRAEGVSAATTRRRCRPGGPWQMPLPGVVLLHPEPPDGHELLHAALLYTGGPEAGAVITGLAALAVQGVTSAGTPDATRRVDVLVPHTRRLRSLGRVRLLRTARPPRPRRVAGLPVAPAARALADALAHLEEPAALRRPLEEAVRLGLCEPCAVIAELEQTGRLDEPPVARAVEGLLAAGRPVAEELLFHMVRQGALPDPCWNVGLWLPDGPFLGDVDAYWPESSVAVRLDTRLPRQRGSAAPTPDEAEATRREQTLRGLGVTVVRITPRALHASWRRQANAVGAALRAGATRPGTDWVVVLPR
ncbi:hypothetical protein SAMN06297387_12528 [Streptomyces zhaozhouensis]|uniref:Transcriptional regulator, AbiEi antitoxin, Type IV TA system n=1 Tax=Streptomyces zhaozhouensis TaxID=1300267 RepID=A0A286E5Z0_9ACTN|nr:hypothetical protein [Streptomyces zhaozhouensis]SOD66322.1 hypothetical protein SAMN06297387_12528 [Streptomyces zhaozhouensis]